MTAFTGYPAGRVEAARAELAKAQRRLERAAARAGQEAPAAPVLTVVREYVLSRCASYSGCGRQWEGVGPCPSGRACGPVKRRALVDLELQAPPARLAGWDFLAVVEPLTGGNLIRQVPGAAVAEGELDAWRMGPIECDHCKAARHRKETFILRGDGAEVPAGMTRARVYKQVGRQCLAAFLGGRSAADIVVRLGWDAIVRGAADEEGMGEGGFGGGPDVYDPAEFLAWCCAIARLDGFVTRAAAQASSEFSPLRATSSKVEWLLGDPPTGETRGDWEAARGHFAPQSPDLERAAATLAWARALPGRTDYEKQLRLVASQQTCQHKHAGILASTVPAYARELGEQVRRTARGPGEHYGAVGERYELTLTVEKVVPIEGFRPGEPAVIATMRDAVGRCFMWRTSSSPGAVGTTVAMKGTVKRHSEFRGEKQTELTRCRVDRPRPARDERRAPFDEALDEASNP